MLEKIRGILRNRSKKLQSGVNKIEIKKPKINGTKICFPIIAIRPFFNDFHKSLFFLR